MGGRKHILNWYDRNGNNVAGAEPSHLPKHHRINARGHVREVDVYNGVYTDPIFIPASGLILT